MHIKFILNHYYPPILEFLRFKQNEKVPWHGQRQHKKRQIRQKILHSPSTTWRYVLIFEALFFIQLILLWEKFVLCKGCAKKNSTLVTLIGFLEKEKNNCRSRIGEIFVAKIVSESDMLIKSIFLMKCGRQHFPFRVHPLFMQFIFTK